MNRQDARGARERVGPEPGRDLDALAKAVVGAAIEVHRHLGPGFLESVYENALDLELWSRALAHARQPVLGVAYKGRRVGEFRPDLIIEDRLIVELKAVEQLDDVHLAQARAYLKATGFSLALVINFNVPVLLRGVRRVVLNA